MNEFDIYNNKMEILKRKEDKSYIKFMILFITLLIILLPISLLYEFDNEYHLQGIVSNNQLMVYIKKEQLKYIRNNKFYIDNKEFDYEVVKIIELDYEVDLQKYFLVSLTTKDELIENDIIDFSIKDGKTTLYKKLKKILWKGF